MDDDTPSAKSLSTAGGYSQIYVIHAADTDAKEADPADTREVLFRCGNWAYRGKIQFNGLKICTPELPVLIPILQKQQGSLRYFCNASAVPENSDYFQPLAFLNDAVDFFATEMVQDSLQEEMRDMAEKFPWIDDDGSATFFEMELSNIPGYMDAISLMASKTYTRGLIIICVYSEQRLYFVVQSGEGDQALLDVRFPDISKHGEGMQLAAYNDRSVPYRKLQLWHAVEKTVPLTALKEFPKLKTLNVSSKSYQQTYCIMKSSWDNSSSVLSVHHDVLFRFGSWCYAGRVQLTSTLALADIPLIIPALRMQQSRLDFLCDTSNVPVTSPFAGALNFVSRTAPLVENNIEKSELLLQAIIEQARRDDPSEAAAIETWLEGDPSESFFELKCQLDSTQKADLNNIEMIASKTYHASGVVTVAIYFESTIYVVVQDAGKENPLLDSRFPDVSSRGRGFNIQSFGDEGSEEWPTLRNVSLWQNKNATNRDHLARMTSKDADSKDTAVTPDAKGVARNLDDEWGVGRGAKGDPEDSMEALADVDAAAARAEAKGSSAAQTERKPADPDSPTTLVRHASFQAADEVAGSKEVVGEVGERIDATAVSGAAVDRMPVNEAQERATTPTVEAVIHDSPTSNTTGKPMFSSPLALADAKNAGNGDSIDFSKSNSTLKAARPHHLPKMGSMNDNLSKKMDDIRRGLAEGEGADAPWDESGKPLLKKKKKKKAEDKELGLEAGHKE